MTYALEHCGRSIWLSIVGGILESRSPLCSQSDKLHRKSNIPTCLPPRAFCFLASKVGPQRTETSYASICRNVQSAKDRTPTEAKEVSETSHPASPARLRTCGCRSSLRSTYPGNLGTAASAMSLPALQSQGTSDRKTSIRTNFKTMAS